MIEAWILVPVFFAGFILAELITLFFCCKHEFETRIHKVSNKCWIYTQTCRHCGKIKTKVVEPRK